MSDYWRLMVAGANAYDEAAQRYRPGGAALEVEIRRLAASGLTAQDIATALRLPLDHVVNVIARVAP